MRSKFERKVADSLKARGVKYEYECYTLEYHEPIRGGWCGDCGGRNATKTRWYTPDFYLAQRCSDSKNDSRISSRVDKGIYIETKGRFTAADRNKMLLVKQAWPDLDIRMVFMADNKISKWSETRYSDWCKKHGFPYAFKDVPDDWIKELNNG